MDYEFYMKWAKEYRDQERVIERLIKDYKAGRKRPMKPYEESYDRKLRDLYQMQLDCRHTANDLEEKARQILNNEISRERKSVSSIRHSGEKVSTAVLCGEHRLASTHKRYVAAREVSA